MKLNEALNILKEHGYLVESLAWDKVFNDNENALNLIKQFEELGITITANVNKEKGVFETVVSLGETFNNNYERLQKDMQSAKENNPSKYGIYKEFIKSLNNMLKSSKEFFNAEFIKDKMELKLDVNPKQIPAKQAYVILIQILTPVAMSIRALDSTHKSEDWYEEQKQKIEASFKNTQQKLDNKFDDFKKEVEDIKKSNDEYSEKVKNILKRDDAKCTVLDKKIMIKLPSKDYENSTRATAALANTGKESCMKYLNTKDYFGNLDLPEGTEIAATTKEFIIYIEKDKFDEKILKKLMGYIKKYVKDFHEALKSDFGDKINAYYESYNYQILKKASMLCESTMEI